MDMVQASILFQVGVKLFSIWGWLAIPFFGSLLWDR
jgi:hypothetical protein